MTSPSPNANPAKAVDSSARANSLGIDQKTLEQVVKKLDQPLPKDMKLKRGFVRWPFPEAHLEILVVTAGGSTTSVRVAARNLSCGGIGILHRSFLHPGTRVRVRLRSITRGIVEIGGAISRCVFKGGVLHDIGIRFDKAIDIHDFASPDLLDERYTLETISPEEVVGNVLYIEDSPMDSKLVKHFLRATKVTLTLATSCAEALAMLKRDIAVILCDYHLADADAPEIVRRLREAGATAPIIVVTSDNSRTMREILWQMGANAFLLKPLTEIRLHRALGEFLLASRWSGRSSAGLDAESLEAMDKAFAEELVAGKQLLVKFVQEKKHKDARAVCSRLAATARRLEFSDLAKLADSAGLALAKTQNCEEAMLELTALMSAFEKQSELN